MQKAIMRILSMNLRKLMLLARETTSHTVEEPFRKKISPGMFKGEQCDVNSLMMVYLA